MRLWTNAMNPNVALERYLRAVEAFAPPDVMRGFFAADVVQEEFPNRLLEVGFGAVAAGTTMRAALVMFFTFRDGKIASVRNYDCYDPF